MPGVLDGRVALVTGGGRGIGRGIALAYAEAGAAVAVAARTAAQVAETVALIEAAGGRALAVTGDVADPAAVATMVGTVEAELGPIGILVNNAGINGPAGPLWEVDPDWWWQAQEVHLRGMFLCTHAVLPGMVARRSGHIITVASGAGEAGRPYFSAYGVAKTAQIRLTEGLAEETREHGVAVFVIAPGYVETSLGEELFQQPLAVKWLPEFHARVQHFREHGGAVPVEVPSQLCVALASGRADALSGRHITVNDDLEALIADAARIQADNRFTLRINR